MASLFMRAVNAVPLRGLPGLGRLLGEYRYHGIFTPGVRLMRNISVGTKVALVAGAFLAPFALTGYAYFKTTNAELSAIQRQMAGAQYMHALQELTLAVQAQRQDVLKSILLETPTPPALSSATLRAPLLQLKTLDESLGSALDTHAALDRVVKAHEAYERAPQQALISRLALLTDYLKSNEQLLAAARQGAGISLEAGGVEYRLMSIGMSRMPFFNSGLFDLVVDGTWALSDPDFMAASDKKIVLTLGSTLSHWHDIKGSIEVLNRLRPDLVAQLKALELIDPTHAYLDAIKSFAVEGRTSLSAQEFLDQGQRTLALTTALQKHAAEAFGAALIERQNQLQRNRQMSIIVVAISLIIASYLLTSMLRVLRGGLDRLRQSVGRMARGDLTEGRRPLGNDEVADTLLSLRESLLKLADLFTVIRQSVRGVEHATQLIADGNHNLSQRTSSSTQSIEAIHHSLDSFRATLDNCAQLINDALPCVHSMDANTTRSINAMGKLQARMDVLQGKSREIGEMVNIIDAIASQTNILALNASVEAARVGEAGKGFAVVANEVRALAQRSAHAAEQIHTIVSTSIDEIEQSHRLAERAAASVQTTADSVQALGNNMNEIVGLMRPGQKHLADVMHALQTVHDDAASHTELIAKLSTAADALRDQGTELSEKVAVFKLHD